MHLLSKRSSLDGWKYASTNAGSSNIVTKIWLLFSIFRKFDYLLKMTDVPVRTSTVVPVKPLRSMTHVVDRNSNGTTQCKSILSEHLKLDNFFV
jgi:hypothetical protein